MVSLLRLCGKDKRNDQTVETQGLSKDENQNHCDKKLWLLRCGSYASVTDDADGHACCKACKTDRETRAKMGKAPEVTVVGCLDYREGRNTIRLERRERYLILSQRGYAPREATMTAIMRP